MTTAIKRRMDRRLQRQIEKILDEGRGNTREVVVRMASPAEDKLALLKLASQVVQQRNMALSAREVLPPPMKSSRRSTKQILSLKGVDVRKSLAQQVVARGIKTPSIGSLQADGKRFLAPLSEWKELHAKEARSQPLWAAKSMVMNLKVDALRALADQEDVRDVYPNRVLLPPKLVIAKSLPIAVQEMRAAAWGVHRIGALAAWGAFNARGRGVRVGILDTGIDGRHPDLKGRIESFAEFNTKGEKIPNAKVRDADTHGTHCAGTICGGNSSGRWIGVAPEAKLVVAKVLDKSGGTDAQVLAGLGWLIEQDVDVISMSLGGLTLEPETPNTYTESILTAIRAGIPVVTAIGNEGHQTTGSPGNDMFAFSVGATDSRDRPAGFSGGRTHIIRESNFIDSAYLPMPYMKPEVSAPGVAVYSSVPGGKWEAMNGTSMATPHVAGAVALLLSATKIRERVPAEERAVYIQDLLSGSAEELGESGQDQRFGFGRIDVLRAIGFALERE